MVIKIQGGESMRKFVKMVMMSMVVAVMVLPMITCQAHTINYQSGSVTDLRYIVGNWYDTRGNLVLNIGNDYSINGCKILSVGWAGDSAAMYKIRIAERNGYRDIELMHYGGDYHETLAINWTGNNGYALRRTKNPRYFESVGGIYLGMDKNQVISLYGQPSKVENNGRWSTWRYDKEGFDVGFDCNIATSITIYSSGDRRFDWSGLSCNSSLKDFKYKYNVSYVSQFIYGPTHTNGFRFRIGHAESISIVCDNQNKINKITIESNSQR